MPIGSSYLTPQYLVLSPTANKHNEPDWCYQDKTAVSNQIRKGRETIIQIMPAGKSLSLKVAFPLIKIHNNPLMAIVNQIHSLRVIVSDGKQTVK